MITFRAVVFAHHKRSDGTYPVKIRVTFRRQTRYIPTTITCTAADLTRSLRIKGADVVARCNEEDGCAASARTIRSPVRRSTAGSGDGARHAACRAQLSIHR